MCRYPQNPLLSKIWVNERSHSTNLHISEIFGKFTRMSMEVSNYLVSWVVTYLGDVQPTYVGVITHLLSTMDIPVGGVFALK